jgi:outer membrane lipoprotein carrier protein
MVYSKCFSNRVPVNKRRPVKCLFLRGAKIAAVCLAAGFASLLFGQGTAELAVTGLQARYAQAESLAGDFRQNYRGPGIEQAESGRVYMKRPGLMRWEYQQPETRLFVADGKETWLYAPADKQVSVRAMSSEELRNTPLQLLLGNSQLLKTFKAAFETSTLPKYKNSALVRLTPRTPQQEYTSIVVEFDVKTSDLQRIVIHEASGNTSEFLLSNIVLNQKLDKKMFEFKPPKGVEVVRVEDK